MIIDTHAHLYYPDLYDNIEKIIEKSSENGVKKIIVPAVDLKSAEIILKMTVRFDEIYAAVGFHPGDLKGYNINDLKYLENYAKEEKVMAIGEIGLDYYWDKSEIEKQKMFFSVQLEIAKDFNLPVIIHTRESVDDAVEIVVKKKTKLLKGQFHCFSGNLQNLKSVLELDDFYVSYCGNLTYKNFKDINIIKNTPKERLLFETDSPFLPPVPFRGKINQPGYLIHTIEKLSDILEVKSDELIKIVYNNTLNLFKFN
ncbi:MAG: TatD family hydrolase [Ignavibacteria bacterium]|nr:TatD family hydrolase [Ignavibacteria bacterium]